MNCDDVQDGNGFLMGPWDYLWQSIVLTKDQKKSDNAQTNTHH
jgi:hypothetical protein